MKSFVEWLSARRYRLVLLSAALAMFPPLGVIGQAVIVFAVLMRGLREGIYVALAATALMTLPALVTGANPAAVLLIAAANWVPALGLAAVLERTRSLSFTVQVATVLMVASVTLFFLMGSPVQTWIGILEAYLEAMDQNVAELPPGLVPELSRIMTGLLGGLTLLSSMAAVFVGRWWQSILGRPGAFGTEFRGLRMGIVVGLLAGVVFIAAALTRVTLLENLTLVLVSGFLLHGLAVMHAFVAAAGMGSVWLVATYVLLVIAMPFAELAVAGLGFVENWFNFRSRLARR